MAYVKLTCPTGADRELEDGTYAKHGEPVEVSDELAVRLLEQSEVWAPSDAPVEEGVTQ